MIPDRTDGPDTRVSGSTRLRVGRGADSGRKVKRAPTDGQPNTHHEEDLAPSVLPFALHRRLCCVIPPHKRNGPLAQFQWLLLGRSVQIRQRPHRIPSHHFIHETRAAYRNCYTCGRQPATMGCGEELHAPGACPIVESAMGPEGLRARPPRASTSACAASRLGHT